MPPWPYTKSKREREQSGIPKNMLVEVNTLHFVWCICTLCDAVVTYNRGNIIKCEVLQRLGLTLGKYIISDMLCIGHERKMYAQWKQKECERLARHRMKGMKRKLNDDISGESDKWLSTFACGPGLHWTFSYNFDRRLPQVYFFCSIRNVFLKTIRANYLKFSEFAHHTKLHIVV